VFTSKVHTASLNISLEQVMKKTVKSDVRERFDQAFGIERLPLFAIHIAALELEGHVETALALKELLAEERQQTGSLNPVSDKVGRTGS
jgi:hypothetical protein